MKVYAISDLHLSAVCNKPMDKFGAKWSGHLEKIKEDWRAKVSMEDVVLLCGDLSWGISLEEAVPDIESLADLPGRKVFCRGNHDYWWHSISKVRAAAPDDTFYFLQNDCVKFDDVVICGSRGWCCPGASDFTPQDEKIYLREAERFRLCKAQVEKVRTEGDTLIVMSHFPPFPVKYEETLFTALFSEMDAKKVVFGHIHGDNYFPFRSTHAEIEYILSSCDKVNFSLVSVL
ncbi:MAG: metallophosphoesterase [Clostridia bacterium]|nr:metallophosphoesterase [Clostridia bacterium]